MGMILVALRVFLQILFVLVLARILFSWFRPRYRTRSNSWFYSIEEVVWRATEPMLAPIRNILPSTGGFDFSTLLLLIIIQFVARLL
jgi:YggT family protein